MNTKKIFSLLIPFIVLIASCTKQPYYNIPRDANGNVVITGVSTATSDGITTLDDKFTVNATFPNAKAGDVMKTELLKLQTPANGGAAQLLPLAGTQKEVTVDNDLKTSVTYTRAEAQMNEPGDYVTVTFAGKTDANSLRVSLVSALKITGPELGDKAVDIMRNDDTAFFDISVMPKISAYTSQVIVKRKNGTNDPWVDVAPGNFTTGSKVPVVGSQFAPGKDTMYYSFIAKQDGFSDTVTTSVIANNPSFLFKKSGTLSLANASQGGVNIFTNGSVASNAPNAVLSVGGGSLHLKGGEAWAVNGKSISFVPATLDQYNKNNPLEAIDVYNSGTPASEADPNEGTGTYIFKLVNGPLPSDIFFGMISITKIVPGTSVDYEYRIGNAYAHGDVFK